MSLWNIFSKLLVDKKPPDEIMVKEKLNASKVLKFINLKIVNITKVRKL